MQLYKLSKTDQSYRPYLKKIYTFGKATENSNKTKCRIATFLQSHNLFLLDCNQSFENIH